MLFRSRVGAPIPDSPAVQDGERVRHPARLANPGLAHRPVVGEAREEETVPARGKTIMFFDNSNIFHGQKREGWRIDAEKMMAKLESGGPIWQVHFFAAVTDPPRFAQTNFYRMLKERLHWEINIFSLGSKTIRCEKCEHTRRAYVEKGVDVAVASKMLTLAMNRAYETAILCSGDKDYLETVRFVKNLGLRVEIVSFRRSLSNELGNESSSPVLLLDDFRADIELPVPDRDAEALVVTE